MSISSIFGTSLPLLKPISSSSTYSPSPRMGTAVAAPPPPPLIECSSRPQKKGTAHHRKTRPKKSQPWDIKRRPTVYAPLPKLPPEWTLASATDTTESVIAPPPPSTDTTTTTTTTEN